MRRLVIGKRRWAPARLVPAEVPAKRKGAPPRPAVAAECLLTNQAGPARDGRDAAAAGRAVKALDRACGCRKKHRAVEADPALPDWTGPGPG